MSKGLKIASTTLGIIVVLITILTLILKPQIRINMEIDFLKSENKSNEMAIEGISEEQHEHIDKIGDLKSEIKVLKKEIEWLKRR